MANGRWYWPDTIPKAMMMWAAIMVLLYAVIVGFNSLLYGVETTLEGNELTNLLFIGGPALWIGLLVVKANLKMQKQLHRLASTDALTGLRNRRAFFDKACRLAESDGGLLVVLDADFFKQINDTFGHAVGDKALVEIAELLARNARQDDVIGRLGGEEFGLFLPSVTAETARNILTRLCAGVTLSHADDRQMTLSAGGALLPPGGSMDVAFRRADEALYTAKRMGRKRFVFAGELSQADTPRPVAHDSSAA